MRASDRLHDAIRHPELGSTVSSKHQVIVEDQPAAEDLDFLEDQVNAFNMNQTGAHDARQLAIFVRNSRREIIAGLSGFTWAGLCEIRFLWVHPARQRQGYGSRLLQAAEQEARARGCSMSILSTYSFQAPAFYHRHGYEIVGQIENCPVNHTNYYLRKRLG